MANSARLCRALVRALGLGLLLSLLLPGCTGTEFGNPSSSNLKLSLGSGDEERLVVGTSEPQAGVIVIESAWIAILRAHLRPCDSESLDDPGVLVYEKQTALDLVGDAGGSFTFEYDANENYCTVNLQARRVEPWEDSSIPTELDEHELFLKGQTPDGRPLLVLWSDVERRLRFTIQGEFTGGDLAIEFDAAVWFEGLDLSAAVPNADGEVVISESSNADLFMIFFQNFDESVTLGTDTNPGAQLLDLNDP
jgi:hypothetical protein